MSLLCFSFSDRLKVFKSRIFLILESAGNPRRHTLVLVALFQSLKSSWQQLFQFEKGRPGLPACDLEEAAVGIIDDLLDFLVTAHATLDDGQQ
jgi:hypothetical protein